MSSLEQEWIAVCNLDDIPPLGARVVKRPNGGPVAVFRTDGDAVFALLDRCPHRGGPLSQGIVHGGQVTCPLHGYNIALDSGCAMLPDEGCTTPFSVERAGDAVLLKRSELATLALDEAAPVAPGPAA
ncbi:nitrite reductase small subunit NirD [Burkholderia guangdongensis]|uniref:nitrite reductase small subunit NirD n=1 Tax=Burkholderia guangdongensis TaxID=1792500 RepID=UPI0015CE6CF1|nr:nitrite reductase small subunit NirD [Burkholderia guangdongensis]